MQVKATKQGFDGRVIRYPGDVFAMPEGAKGSWFSVIPVAEKSAEEKSEAKPKKEPKEKADKA